MRHGLIAFLSAASVAVATLPAAAQANRDGQQAVVCGKLAAASVRASNKVTEISDEISMHTRVLAQRDDSSKMSGLTTAQLDGLARGADAGAANARERLRETDLPVSGRREMRRDLAYYSYLGDMIRALSTARVLGPIDATDNAYVRMRKRADRRLPKLKAELPRAVAAAKAAFEAQEQCWAGVRDATPRPAEAAPAGPRQRDYRTSFGDMTLVADGAKVRATYAYDTGAHFANGTVRDVDLPPGFKVSGGSILGPGRLTGQRSGNVIEGYWVQPDGAQACPAPRDGRPVWGLFRFTVSGGKWVGQRGLCDGPLDREWNGEPK